MHFWQCWGLIYRIKAGLFKLNSLGVNEEDWISVVTVEQIGGWSEKLLAQRLWIRDRSGRVFEAVCRKGNMGVSCQSLVEEVVVWAGPLGGQAVLYTLHECLIELFEL